MFFNSRREWGSVAKFLHWVMAVLIVAMFVLGWVARAFPLSPAKLELFIWHKSIGLTLLGLLIIRLAWRAFSPIPRLPDGMSDLERMAARVSHIVLYALMILMPVSGYVINSTANFSFRFFGWIRVPNIVPPNESWQDTAELAHMVLFWIFASVVVLHTAAALRHHVSKKDDVLTRMLPGRRQR